MDRDGKDGSSNSAPPGTAQQVLATLPQSDNIEYASLVNCLEQRFGQKHLAPLKRRELKNHVQKCGEGLQDYAADIWRLAQEVYPNINLEFVESTAVESFVDGIWDWEVQSLVHMHSSKNITTALAFALEVEAARRTSLRPVMVHQIREENPKKPKSSSNKWENIQIRTWQVSFKKKHAWEVQISQPGCNSSNVYITAWSDHLKKISICVDTEATA